MLLVSDKDACNRLCELVAPRELNAGLRRLGLRHARLVQHLAVGDKPLGASYQPRALLRRHGRPGVSAQPAAYWVGAYPAARLRPATMRVGHAYLSRHDSLVQRPLDFSQVTCLRCATCSACCKLGCCPKPYLSGTAPAPTAAATLPEALSELPPRNRSPRYDSLRFRGTYAKYLLGGGLVRLPPWEARV